MNKSELEIAKKIARIEGVSLFQSGSEAKYWQCNPSGNTMINGRMYSEYNPFDWSILGLLMVRHNVSFNHDNSFVFINEPFDYHAEYFSGKEDIPRSILECIIKSQESK